MGTKQSTPKPNESSTKRFTHIGESGMFTANRRANSTSIAAAGNAISQHVEIWGFRIIRHNHNPSVHTMRRGAHATTREM
jgi:hypothetical protein